MTAAAVLIGNLHDSCCRVDRKQKPGVETKGRGKERKGEGLGLLPFLVRREGSLMIMNTTHPIYGMHCRRTTAV